MRNFSHVLFLIFHIYVALHSFTVIRDYPKSYYNSNSIKAALQHYLSVHYLLKHLEQKDFGVTNASNDPICINLVASYDTQVKRQAYSSFPILTIFFFICFCFLIMAIFFFFNKHKKNYKYKLGSFTSYKKLLFERKKNQFLGIQWSHEYLYYIIPTNINF